MRLVFHNPEHRKNVEGIRMMCASRGIDLEFTRDDSRILRADYDILVMNTKFIDPDTIPANVKIIFGPQHWVYPSGPLMGPHHPEWSKRCAFNILSDWVGEWYQEYGGEMRIPKIKFPYAVDIDRFRPLEGAEKTFDCLVYCKARHPSIYEAAGAYLSSHGFSYRVFKYGSYTENEYIAALQTCKFVLVLDAHESQGFAVQEAMSCNVPMIVYSATSMYDEYNDGRFSYEHLRPRKALATTVPYWSDKCGVQISDLSELSTAIPEILTPGKYNPREFILETLSAGPCMDRILSWATRVE